MTHSVIQSTVQPLKGGLIVSCQAEPELGSKMSEPRDVARMATEVLEAGACAVRICGINNIAETKRQNPTAIIIGITKALYPDGRVLITPNRNSIMRIAEAGADIIGMDMTQRVRPCGRSALDLYRLCKRDLKSVLFMADIATIVDAHDAILAGVDLIGTTLSGYTPETENTLNKEVWFEHQPDVELVKMLTSRYPNTPIIAEGRWRTPQQCFDAIHIHGAWAVCAGSQITRPRMITRWHVQALERHENN
ncbi:MAG: putative N-acetylmannosamine-6-phosphate 2-epimerase [bacterium]|nr:putative N-acetylmannosamine-6-phosphate 2-epimerase [bacterium]